MSRTIFLHLLEPSPTINPMFVLAAVLVAPCTLIRPVDATVAYLAKPNLAIFTRSYQP